MKKNKSLFKRIANGVSSVLAILIVLVCAAMFLLKGSDNVLFVGKYACIFVMSESMEPSIPARSFILVEKVSAKDVQVGDVIMFESDDPLIQGSYNTHQVMEIIGDHEEFVTKGTNNPIQDQYTAKAGKVKARYIRNAGLLTACANWFLKPQGLLITLIAIVIICCAVYLPDIIRAEANSKETDED